MASEAKRVKKDLNEILIEQLKCYICKSGVKVGKHRWYRCPQQHMICQDCMKAKEASSVMPTCDCKKKIHGYCKMTEAMLCSETMRFNCENQLRGCQVKLGSENMIFHQSECIFRLVQCPNLKCLSKVTFLDLLNHMKTEEFKCPKQAGSIGKTVATFWTLGENCDQLPVVIFASQELEVNGIGTFIIGATIENGTFYHWIHFLGSSHEAKKFSYTFEYKNEEKTPHVHTFHSNQMVSIDETSKSIIESGKCFGMPRKLFDKHVLEDRRFAYSVTIRNLKEEAKDDNVESGVSDNDD